MRYTIVTVCRNHLGGLQRTHQSLAAQTCRDFEWIVVDGASQDGTVEFLHSAAASWTSEPDHGIYDAMNKGLARARGDYVLFLNAGDILAAPDVLQRLAESDSDFLYGDAIEDGKLKPARPHDRLRFGMITHHQAMLYRRSLLDGLRYDTRFQIAADYKFTWQFLCRAQSCRHFPLPVCIFEPGGLSQRQTRQGRQEQYVIRRMEEILPHYQNLALYLWQFLTQSVRHACPSLYWAIRQRTRETV